MFDEIFNIDPELAKPENPDYRRFEKGLTWMAVGGLSVYGANMVDVADLHNHARTIVGIAGSMEMWSGGIMIAAALDKIKKRDSTK